MRVYMMNVCATVYVCRSEDNFQEISSLLPLCGPRNRTLGDPLIHLHGPGHRRLLSCLSPYSMESSRLAIRFIPHSYCFPSCGSENLLELLQVCLILCEMEIAIVPPSKGSPRDPNPRETSPRGQGEGLACSCGSLNNGRVYCLWRLAIT